MHAFLIIGNPASLALSGVNSLSKKLKTNILTFPIQKIDDVRSLNNLIRLHFDEKTLVVCENIHEATEEALNAFLKNLEEPQENIYFALTATSIRKVLPTIVSRCQIIKTLNSKSEILNKDQISKFLNSKTDERLAYIDQVRDRPTAVKFVEDLIFFERERKNYKNMENYLTAYRNLKANGNINLQLSNVVVSLV